MPVGLLRLKAKVFESLTDTPPAVFNDIQSKVLESPAETGESQHFAMLLLHTLILK
jgi:hypothetical protein